jgi:hypothetical protein
MAVIWLAKALKDVVQEGVFAYVLPCEHMVYVLGLFYLTPA